MSDTRFKIRQGDRRELQRTFEQVPKASRFSTSDGPNSSGVTGVQGQIGIEEGSSGTAFWICDSGGTNNWKEFALPENVANAGHTHEASDITEGGSPLEFESDIHGSDLSLGGRLNVDEVGTEAGSEVSFLDPMAAPEIDVNSDLTVGGTINPGANTTLGSGLAWGGTGTISKSSHVVQFTNQAFSVTNGQLDNSYNADTVTVDELADVVFTMLSQLSMT